MTICAQLCLSEEQCSSAIFDDSTKACDLHICNLDDAIKVGDGSDIVYLQVQNVVSIDIRSILL